MEAVSQSPADFPRADQLVKPVEPYDTADYHRFAERIPGRIGWCRFCCSTHLGDDLKATPGASVKAIGAGTVVWAKVHAGSSAKRSWGGLIVVGHRHVHTNIPFYSLYGHVAAIQVKSGDRVVAGQVIGKVAQGQTAESGFWPLPHLHFAIYTGPWRGVALPGYKRWRFFWRTRLRWWHDPRDFIKNYPQ